MDDGIVRDVPQPGETAFLDDTRSAGLLLRDGVCILGAKGAALNMGDHATLIASRVDIVGGMEIRLRGNVVVEGEIVTGQSEEPMSVSKTMALMADVLRGKG